MHRPTVGILAIVLLLVGGVLYFFGPSNERYQEWIGGCIRVGAVLGALWLALPQLRRLPNWMVPVIFAMCMVLALRPRLFVVAFVLALVIAFVRPRTRTT